MFTLLAGLGMMAAGTGAYLYLNSPRQRIIRIARAVVPFPREHATNKIVGQGRGFWKGYSGCGDLWNYVLDMIGAPNDWVNRDSPRRGIKWKEQVNISQPWGKAAKADARVKWKPGGPWPKAGDLILIGDESLGELAHVLVLTKVLGPPQREGWSPRYQSAEYGGGSNASSVGEREWDNTGMAVKGWKRHIVGWIDADKIPIDPKWS